MAADERAEVAFDADISDAVDLAELGAASSSQKPSVGVEDEPVQPTSSQGNSSVPPTIVYLWELGQRGHAFLVSRVGQPYLAFLGFLKYTLDLILRTLKLIGFSIAIIFIVGIASWFIAFTQWCSVVVGHLALRAIVPRSLDNSFHEMKIEQTMIFAVIGAVIVNIPPFVVFLISFLFNFNRTVIEGNAAPALEFMRRITPENHRIRLALKYTPRLLVAPIGYFVVREVDRMASYPELPPPGPALEPLRVVIIGLAGEIVFTGLGRIKGSRFVQGVGLLDHSST
ncbi:uncharacterized protein BXZ73DRAFT_73058 [Epithele typhae]|uniref:uncharacterized protein n=1 Tax=Epithele typhae TaxID=378194 RepID=UPI002008ACFF|nr:uncharacterized protein BXZ73DRAFT_73058 [Epithele typhae]KAH9946263.1 hypothetical protein BXZ73DRAFT_73058 [Epithele typhae]